MKRLMIMCSAIGGIPLLALAQEPSNEQLMEQIRALQAKVAALEAAQQKQQASEADVDATVKQVMRAADVRSGRLLAGHEEGKFFLRSSDDSFLLNPGVQIQFRHVFSSTEDIAGDQASNTESGFEIRRLKFNFAGHVFTPRLTYNFQWEADQNGGEVTLEEGWLRYHLFERWYLRGGQFKDPTFHEERTSSRRQLAVDRSLLNEQLAGGVTDYVQGISAIYDSDPAGPLRFELGYIDAADSINTSFRDPPANPTNWGIVGRADWFITGDRKAYDDFSAGAGGKNKRDLFVLGAAALLDQGGDTDRLFHTIDAQWENTAGLAAYGALIGQWIEDAEAEAYNWGALVQAGYMLTDRWEIFGRYDVTLLDDAVTFDGGGSDDEFHEITIGVNYYLRGHSAKFTIDISYLPNGAPSNHSGIGVLAAEDDSLVIRGQFQLLL